MTRNAVTLSERNTGKLDRALSLLEEGLIEKAIEVLRELVKEEPDRIEGWYNLGYALTMAEEYEEAVKAYDEALAIDNFIFEIWFNKGAALYALRDFEAARECYEEALEINPDDAEAWNNLGNCHSRLADGEAAIEAYNKANAHFIEEQDERAIAYAEVAVQLNPELEKMVGQWISVARNRLAAKREDAEYKRRQLEGKDKN
jgi:tetratricopeptide (TPR) repeat protein